MCTRYYIARDDEYLSSIGGVAREHPLYVSMREKLGQPVKTEGEIFPGDIVPVIAVNKNGEERVFPMKWGYTFPGGKKLVLNARSESAAGRPLFSEGFLHHRCVIPASFYYEWESRQEEGGVRKIKHIMKPQAVPLCRMAAIYRIEDGFPRFTILTREADESILYVHDRMPVIFSEEAGRAWIRPDADPAAMLGQAAGDVAVSDAGL